MNVLLLLFLIFSTCFALKKEDWFTNYAKETCGFFGPFSVGWCHVKSLSTSWKPVSVGWSPDQTLNQTLDELKEHCDSSFVCYENTGCVRDYANYQQMDKCVEEVFQLGPWSFCEDKLREIQKKTPDVLGNCTRHGLDDSNPPKMDCLSIYETAKCYLDDVEKHCQPQFFELYKQYYKLRLFNRACDGRLRYKDWDYRNGKDFAIDISPGVFKVSDPKRDFNSTGLFPEIN